MKIGDKVKIHNHTRWQYFKGDGLELLEEAVKEHIEGGQVTTIKALPVFKEIQFVQTDIGLFADYEVEAIGE